jgi:hypothetical protein
MLSLNTEVKMKSFSIRTLVARTLGVASIAALACGATLATAEPPAQQSTSAGSTGAQVVSKAHAAQPDYILTPKGVFAHRECVHALDEGDVVDQGGNIRKKSGTIQVIAACAHPEIPARANGQGQGRISGVQAPTDNGWTETAFWNAPGAVGQFQSEFHVPAAPSNFDGQLIYIFPALEGVAPTGGEAILQPVLQYGNNGGWGGQYWTLNSWAGGGGEYNGNYYNGNVISVSTGDVIYGDMEGNPDNCNGNGCLWEVVGSDLTNGQTSTYGTYINISWTQVFALAIEVYGVDTCADYPATYDNSFDFFITGWVWSGSGPQWTPQWSPSINVETCGETITSNSGLVNLYY